MRNVILSIIVFTFSFCLNAQNRPLQKPDLFKIKKNNTDSSFIVVPRLELSEGFRNSLLAQGEIYLKNPALDIESVHSNTNAFEGYNMPVYVPPLVTPMPIHKPDSSIKYHIIIKDLSRKSLQDRLVE